MVVGRWVADESEGGGVDGKAEGVERAIRRGMNRYYPSNAHGSLQFTGRIPCATRHFHSLETLRNADYFSYFRLSPAKVDQMHPGITHYSTPRGYFAFTFVRLPVICNFQRSLFPL